MPNTVAPSEMALDNCIFPDKSSNVMLARRNIILIILIKQRI